MTSTNPSFMQGLLRRIGTLPARAVPVAFAACVVSGCGGDDAKNAAPGDSGTGGVLFGSGGASTGGSQDGSGGATTGAGGRSKGSGGRRTGAGGATADGGTTAAGSAMASGGATSSGGTTSDGGATSSGGAHGGATGQPVGAICVNDSNCSQSGGMAVCCAIPGCTGPCECRLTAQCPKGSLFLECMTAKDCTAYGGGKVCCEAGSGAQTMRYCTKPSGCSGTVLP